MTYTAFVEFGDEEAMKAGLAKHEEVRSKLQYNQVLVLMISTETEGRCTSCHPSRGP